MITLYIFLVLLVLTIVLHIFSYWNKTRSTKKLLRQQKALFPGEMEFGLFS